ncbi:phosphohydrolase [Solemya pervernicosa gill symbiont]|uniref:Phosphohydrolase n=2 Tax=Gammaproteobacteria incertae sedis TaxID=118884 RepID=A0A1T2L427_9GAMM|nr:HD-GYP domain-containing protein [Candidatus Reidiella endopervernicosa]OOZ39839.1 phosphohydrolase [Solemya pervernicosa gill symbiont]QKQ27482.1 HD-GYP domain-containing protein [Candidatus Reidiella endopervernicosa]
MFNYQDTLHKLNDLLPLSEKLNFVHGVLRDRFDYIDRIAVTLYDEKTDTLKTFIQSSDGENPMQQYEAKLSEVPLLQEIINQGRPRVVNNLLSIGGTGKLHTQRLVEKGYASSYTMPMSINGSFFGFIFFNSFMEEVLDEEVLHYLDLIGHLISLTVINDLTNIRTLLAAVKTARDMTHQRDLETGTHLDRMAHYSRLIATEIAKERGLSDEFIENVYLFSPLHDIGKIGIPDKILLKPGKLDEEEFEVMKSHAVKGREIIDTMLQEFGLDGLDHIDILRNIAAYHHEAVNGSGYPEGLKDQEIPLESKIIAVADIFDALTSSRPYKEAWDNEVAFNTLRELAGKQLDASCVEALLSNHEKISEIQDKFGEDRFG